jgi:hypothetical protein
MRNPRHRKRRKKRCGNKIRYRTREDACHNMGLLARTANTQNLSVYRCAKCHEYHVGHLPAKIRDKYGV